MLEGKGFYIWILSQCEKGNPQAIAEAARAAGLSHVLFKIADGPAAFNRGLDVPVRQALQEAGIQAWGWHYVYGDQPEAEADMAIQRVQELGLDGYVIDAEAEYKHRPSQAQRFARRLRDGLPDTPLALSSFRFPAWHPELPWNQFLEVCDLHMPQVYWEQAHNVAWQLAESKRQCDALAEARPYVPTGATYGTPSWAATRQDIEVFLRESRKLGLSAVNFYSWDYARAHLPNLWEAVAAFDWPFAPPPRDIQPPPEESQDFASRWLDAVRQRHLEAALALYDRRAVLAAGARVYRGTTGVRLWLQRLWRDLPDTADLVLVDAVQQDDLIRLQWQAQAEGGELLRAAHETFILSPAEQVLLHYTFYTLADGSAPVLPQPTGAPAPR